MNTTNTQQLPSIEDFKQQVSNEVLNWAVEL